MDSPQQQNFGFKNISLLKSEALGAGSYGRVCKATCDGLPCAAKIIHPTLFDLNDPGAASFMHKFEQECRLLRMVRHPNIVQYLATYRDPETGLPVLLMEICNESLCKFLERLPGPLPYHTEINISHDIALALVYLHSNDVIHRDLTGNNVPMMATARAKVTDFGMSKLTTVNPRTTPLTTCPGNLLYMSPEALDEPPSYTRKLDMFSFGVLAVQIMTRQFPDPGPRFSMVSVSNDPRFPGGNVRVPVLETQRRSKHLKLIYDSHPLKQLALGCLNDVQELRPSALHLADSLQELKQSQLYIDSVELSKATDDTTSGSREKITSLRRQVHDLKQRDIEKQHKIDDQQRKLKSLQDEKQQKLQEMAEKIRQLQGTVEEREKELHISRQLVARVQQSLHQKEKTIASLQQTVSTHEATATGQPEQRAAVGIYNWPPPLGGFSARPPRPQQQRPLNTHVTMRFDGSLIAQDFIKRGAVAVFRDTAFVNPDASNKVYQITKGVDHWNVLSDNPYVSFGLVVFSDGRVTSVGGWNGTTYSNQLLTLNSNQRWDPARYPAMPTARIETVTVNTSNVLVVAGGFDGRAMLDTVEVLTLYNMQWATASCLPHPFYQASGIVCRDQIYLAGGYVARDVKSKSVLTCSLIDLFHSPSLEAGVRSRHSTVWQQAGQLPLVKSTLVCQGGKLLAVGGKDESGCSSSGILTYDTHEESWKYVCDMTMPRNRCFAIAFSGDTVYVMGGEPRTDSIEIRTLVESGMRL